MGTVELNEGPWHVGCLASSVHISLWEKQGTWYPVRHRNLKSSTFFPHKNSSSAVPYLLYLLYPQSLAYIAPGTRSAPRTCWMRGEKMMCTNVRNWKCAERPCPFPQYWQGAEEATRLFADLPRTTHLGYTVDFSSSKQEQEAKND